MKQLLRSPEYKGSFKSMIKLADFYGYPITLTYNNKQMYKTYYGGMYTILSVLGVLIYFFIGISGVIN